jgi:predicted secreted protein
MSKLIGSACKLYYNSASYATPTYTGMEGLISDTLDLTMAPIDVTDKDDGLWRKYIAGIRDWTASFEARLDTGSVAQEKMIDDFLASTQVLTKIEYKTSNSSKYSGDCLGTSWSLSNAFDAEQKVSGTLTGDGALTQAAV